VYQLAVGLKLLHLGKLPGEGPPLDRLFLLVPVYTLIVGGVALVPVAFARHEAAVLSRHWALRAMPIAAAAYPFCRAAAFDPYYLPSLERFWVENVNPAWLVALMALALGVTVLCVRRPGSTAVALTGVAMIASGVTAMAEGLH